MLLGQSGVGWVSGEECKSHPQGRQPERWTTKHLSSRSPTPRCDLAEDCSQHLLFGHEEPEVEGWKESVAGPSSTADLAVKLWPPDPAVCEPCHP